MADAIKLDLDPSPPPVGEGEVIQGPRVEIPDQVKWYIWVAGLAVFVTIGILIYYSYKGISCEVRYGGKKGWEAFGLGIGAAALGGAIRA